MHRTSKKLVVDTRKLLSDKNYRISSKIVVQDENRVVGHMPCTTKTLGKDETERIHETKVPKGLKQILIEDVVTIKVHFKTDFTNIAINIVNTDFKLVPKIEYSSPKTDHKKKVIVSKWFEGLVYCHLSN